MKYDRPDYGDWQLNTFHLIGVVLIALIFLWKVPHPWKNILGVSILWFPIIALQFKLDRPILGGVLILIALGILKSVWNDD
ncbi:hypothetical protein DESC_460164 [Desulfosarcina cetonica]|nr:hypothetical protein DESC_460164 [Desulfosarcina cetonica]